MAFKPKKGQTDFSNARWAPVINCVLKCGPKILIVARSGEVGFYKGVWNGISGFLDDKKSFEEKVREEIKDEVGISDSGIRTIRRGEIFHQEDPKYEKTWIVHPVLVEVHKDKITLDAESISYKWIAPQEVRNFRLLPGFDRVLENLSLI